MAWLRAATDAVDLWVLHEIDPQALIERGGYLIGEARQVLFFHPRHVARLLEADPAALIEAPLKFAVLAMPGGQASVYRNDPVTAFGRYGKPALAELGRELAAACERIATAALGD